MESVRPSWVARCPITRETMSAKLRNGQTPLMVALRHRQAHAVAVLLHVGADVHARCDDRHWFGNWTALHLRPLPTTLIAWRCCCCGADVDAHDSAGHAATYFVRNAAVGARGDHCRCAQQERPDATRLRVAQHHMMLRLPWLIAAQNSLAFAASFPTDCSSLLPHASAIAVSRCCCWASGRCAIQMSQHQWSRP